MKKLLTYTMMALMAYNIYGCAKSEAPKRETYQRHIGGARTANGWELLDTDDDGRIDALGDRESFLAIDTTVIPKREYESIGGRCVRRWTSPMDSNTISIATEMSRLERELSFRLDSTHYAGRNEK